MGRGGAEFRLVEGFGGGRITDPGEDMPVSEAVCSEKDQGDSAFPADSFLADRSDTPENSGATGGRHPGQCSRVSALDVDDVCTGMDGEEGRRRCLAVF